MSPMNSSEIKKLKMQAHKLNPVVIIGGNGLTENVHKEIDTALKAHELIKIRVNALDKDERAEMVGEICDRHDAVLIQTIGHVVVMYREKEDNG